jgi:hypothetical protein
MALEICGQTGQWQGKLKVQINGPRPPGHLGERFGYRRVKLTLHVLDLDRLLGGSVRPVAVVEVKHAW